MSRQQSINLTGTFTVDLGLVGFITWIVFMIMDYGCHMDWIVNANSFNPSLHFWTWFPLWAPIAIGFAFFVLAVIIVCILNFIVYLQER